MKIHMSTSIDGLLAMSDAKMKKMLSCVQDENGRSPTLDEFKDYLHHERYLGHKLLRCPECDNFDPVKGCLGHND